MQCKSLWIKASAKCKNVNVNVFAHSDTRKTQKETQLAARVCQRCSCLCALYTQKTAREY